MNRCIHIISYETLTKKYSILVVITFPSHETDKRVLTEGNLTIRCRWTISNNISCLNLITLENNRSLVIAVTLVTSWELSKLVFTRLAILFSDNNLVRFRRKNNTISLCNYTYAWVNSSLILNTSSDNRSFCHKKRYGLTLHVRTHEGTCTVIILKEWNHWCSNWEYHLRRYIHKINLALIELRSFFSVTSRYSISYEITILINLSISLCYMEIIFLISCEVTYFISNSWILRIRLIYNTIRSFNESIFINSCIRCKRVNKTNVRSFRSLDRTHSTIMSIVYISNLETCTISWKTTRTKGWKTSLMSNLTKRVILIHELWQLRTSEEFLNSSCYRLNINKWLWRYSTKILCRHSLTDHSFHSWDTNSELVLKKLSYSSDTSVSKVIDIVLSTNTIFKVHIIINRSKNIFYCNMLRNKVSNVLSNSFLNIL